MKRIKWRMYNAQDHDAKVAKRLRRFLLKVYKYAAKHGLWEVRMVVTNDANAYSLEDWEDVGCYAEVSAWYYNANVVYDAALLPIIEESL